MEKYQQMLEIFNELEGELRLYHVQGDPIASKRARNKLLRIKRLAKAMRDDLPSNSIFRMGAKK
jgi:hypothetical protein